MKKAFNIAANVCAIILMSILLIGDIILMNALTVIGDLEETYLTTTSIETAMAICIMLLMFSITTIIISAFALAKGNYDDHGIARVLKIIVIVLIGIIAILEFIGGGLVYGLLCLIPIGLEITSICVQNQKNSIKTKPSAFRTVDDKINELKKLKSLHAISDEQYEIAVTNIINDIKNN